MNDQKAFRPMREGSHAAAKALVRTSLSVLTCLLLVICPFFSVYGDDVPFWRRLIEKRLDKIRSGEARAPLLHSQQVSSLSYIYYFLEGGGSGEGEPLQVVLPKDGELEDYQALRARTDSQALDYLDELYGKRDDLKALALRDSDGDGVPDYRVSDYYGKFMEGDVDVDGDGVRNIYDSGPYDPSAGGRDADGDGVPDVAGTYADANANGLPDHLDWAIHKNEPRMVEIQWRLFDRFNVILVERNASFDAALAEAVDDALNKVLRAQLEQSKGIATLRTVAVEQTALLGKFLAAIAEDSTSAQVFSQSQSLTIYDAGRNVPYDVGLFGLLVHELGHSYHMSLDYESEDPTLENGRTQFPAPIFVQLIEPFGWARQGYYDAELAGQLSIVPRFAYAGISEPLFRFKGSTPEEWDEWVWQTYDRLGQPPDYLERQPFRERAIVSDYSLTTPYEWYGDNLLAYVVLELEQQLLADLAKQGRAGEAAVAKQKIKEAMREIWPGFYHGNIAPQAVIYFRRLFPILPEHRSELAKKYLQPLVDS